MPINAHKNVYYRCHCLTQPVWKIIIKHLIDMNRIKICCIHLFYYIKTSFHILYFHIMPKRLCKKGKADLLFYLFNMVELTPICGTFSDVHYLQKQTYIPYCRMLNSNWGKLFHPTSMFYCIRGCAWRFFCFIRKTKFITFCITCF